MTNLERTGEPTLCRATLTDGRGLRWLCIRMKHQEEGTPLAGANPSPKPGGHLWEADTSSDPRNTLEAENADLRRQVETFKAAERVSYRELEAARRQVEEARQEGFEEGWQGASGRNASEVAGLRAKVEEARAALRHARTRITQGMYDAALGVIAEALEEKNL